MTAILPVLDAGSTAANESSCWASRLTRGARWRGRQQRHEVRRDGDRRPRVDGVRLVERGGDLDGGVHVHRIEHQGAAVGRAQRELPVVRSFELPLADVAGRDAQPEQRAAHGAVEAGGQRPAGDHLGGGAGRAVVDHGRLQRARDVGARQQRGVRQLRGRHVPAAVLGQRGQRRAGGERRFARQLPGRGGAWPARTGTARGRCLAPSTAPARRPPVFARCAPGRCRRCRRRRRTTSGSQPAPAGRRWACRSG